MPSPPRPSLPDTLRAWALPRLGMVDWGDAWATPYYSPLADAPAWCLRYLSVGHRGMELARAMGRFPAIPRAFDCGLALAREGASPWFDMWNADLCPGSSRTNLQFAVKEGLVDVAQALVAQRPRRASPLCNTMWDRHLASLWMHVGPESIALVDSFMPLDRFIQMVGPRHQLKDFVKRCIRQNMTGLVQNVFPLLPPGSQQAVLHSTDTGMDHPLCIAVVLGCFSPSQWPYCQDARGANIVRRMAVHPDGARFLVDHGIALPSLLDADGNNLWLEWCQFPSHAEYLANPQRDEERLRQESFELLMRAGVDPCQRNHKALTMAEHARELLLEGPNALLRVQTRDAVSKRIQVLESLGCATRIGRLTPGTQTSTPAAGPRRL